MINQAKINFGSEHFDMKSLPTEIFKIQINMVKRVPTILLSP